MHIKSMALELSKAILKQAFKERDVETSFSQEEFKSTERKPSFCISQRTQ